VQNSVPSAESFSAIVRQNTQASVDDNKQRNLSAKQALNGPKAKWIESKERRQATKPLIIRKLFDKYFAR
jgi:hypothetical protein